MFLYFVMKKILFKPVTDFMENRQNSIQNSIDSAEQQKAEAFEMKQNYENQLKEAKAEGLKIIEELTAKANRVHDNIIEDAKLESQTIMTNARKDIENEREQMLKEIRNEIASLALSAASKVMEDNMNTKENRALVDKFLDEAGVA